jgi:FtsP/CotA-like multicopper oxidase with cupredoxin domain
MRSIRLRSAVLLLAAAAVTAGCSGSSDAAAEPADSTPDTTTASAPASDSASPSASGSSSASPEFRGVSIEVKVADGTVTPPTHRVDVEQGQRVRLTVTSDVADEIHVHGYDKSKDLEPGVPGTLTFRADQSGIFEVELEERALQLVQLEVR